MIRLGGPVLAALMQLAASERRDTRRQAEVMIEADLLRRGLLGSPAKPESDSWLDSALGPPGDDDAFLEKLAEGEGAGEILSRQHSREQAPDPRERPRNGERARGGRPRNGMGRPSRGGTAYEQRRIPGLPDPEPLS
jgi:hypothetical protein